MKSTSRSSRLVSCAARSPALAITGPEVERKLTAELAGDDLRERRLAQARRPDEEHMVEGVAPGLRRIDEDLEVGARGLLAREIVERQRPDRRFGIVLALLGTDQAAGIGQRGLPSRGFI